MEIKNSDIDLALEHSRRVIAFKQQHEEIKAEVERRLTVSFNGGLFKISYNLIIQASHERQLGKTLAVIPDADFRPIEVDLVKFLETVHPLWDTTMAWYYTAFTELEQARNVEGILCPKA